MPSKPFDARILMLAHQATTEIVAFASLEPVPEGLTPMTAESPAYPWEWADVTVTATYAGVTESTTIKGVKAQDERDFKRGEAYQRALHKVLGGLLRKLDRAAEAMAGLGPKRGQEVDQ